MQYIQPYLNRETALTAAVVVPASYVWIVAERFWLAILVGTLIAGAINLYSIYGHRYASVIQSVIATAKSAIVSRVRKSA